MSTTQRILNSLEYHTNLVKQISELEDAPDRLEKQIEFRKELETNKTRTMAEITGLEKLTVRERRGFEDVRDSRGRKWMATLAGNRERFESRLDKEQREYAEALEKELEEKTKLAKFEQMIFEASAVERELRESTCKLSVLGRDLSDLYTQVFDAEPSDFPADVELTRHTRLAQAAYDNLEPLVNKEKQVISHLQAAEDHTKSSLAKLDRVYKPPRWHSPSEPVIHFLDWTPSTEYIDSSRFIEDCIDRLILVEARRLANIANTSIAEASVCSHFVVDVPEIEIPEMSQFAGRYKDASVMRSNVFTKVNKVRAEIRKTLKKLATARGAASGRLSRAESDLSEALESLDETRDAQNAYRRSLFDHFTAHGTTGGESQLPPAPWLPTTVSSTSMPVSPPASLTPPITPSVAGLPSYEELFGSRAQALSTGA